MKRKLALAMVCALSVSASMTAGVTTYAADKETETTEAAESSEAETKDAEAKETEKSGTDSKDAADSETKDTDAKDTKSGELEDGVYSAEFDTDSSMFHVNEAKDGKGTLTVKDGKMTIHVTLASKKIVNLFAGTAEDAKKDGAKLLEPTEDEVTYSDGYTETAYGFDIPVPALDEEFDVALLGTKGKWYDHKVSVSNPQKEDAAADASSDAQGKSVEDLKLEDGNYTGDVTLEGGSGRATVESPAEIEIKDGKATATVVWSSSNYDYMIVDGEKYEMTNTDGNSTFEIPVLGFDYKMPVKADTVAMSEPHEIDYTLQFDSESMKKAK